MSVLASSLIAAAMAVGCSGSSNYGGSPSYGRPQAVAQNPKQSPLVVQNTTTSPLVAQTDKSSPLVTGSTTPSPLIEQATIPTSTAQQPEYESAVRRSNLLSEALEAGQLSTFVRAVEAAGLDTQLRDGGPLTVFAPTDQAFEALPEGTLNALMQPAQKGELQSLLSGHIAKGRTQNLKAQAGQGKALTNLQGEKLELSLVDGNVTIKNARVVREIPASNGTLYIIDTVISPTR